MGLGAQGGPAATSMRGAGARPGGLGLPCEAPWQPALFLPRSGSGLAEGAGCAEAAGGG